MEKVRPWCDQLSDRGRLKNRTEQNRTFDNREPLTSTATSDLNNLTLPYNSEGLFPFTAHEPN